TIRRRFDQERRANILAITIEVTVGIGQRTLGQFIPLLPDKTAGLEVLAHPALAIRVAVQVVPQQDDTSVVIHHILVGVNLLALQQAVAPGAYLEKGAAHAVSGTHIDEVVVDNGGGDRGRTAGTLEAPKETAVFSRDAGDALSRHLHVLPYAEEGGHDHGRV